ncbi:hypothetical protein M011DRAFT_444288 [Sporormia fimetaria CBS 119925]|uniref:Transcription factor TFIIIC triple barrel domain-containing protein n=1 Tax=Sporormia fimetaria CBS 119925 TaxID=1340428 RepID=A0A6A6VDE6_9PLEO|nr:hypothetical protein M011DRAFT_444288 [Sporormia fimetaria CBS 119925]
MADENEDEWEYEYDDAATEDFYITLDLTNVPDKGNTTSARSAQPAVGYPILLQTRLRALEAMRRQGETVADTVNDQAPSFMGEMQVSGLHTEKPLIMYNGQLLSCSWASSIGTDMLFVKPKTEERPLRSLPDVDLLATSSVKLMATAARLRPRDEVIEDFSTEQAATAAPKSNQNTAQAKGFLARLNEIKAKRGEAQLVMAETAAGSRLMATRNATENGSEDVEMQNAEG